MEILKGTIKHNPSIDFDLSKDFAFSLGGGYKWRNDESGEWDICESEDELHKWRMTGNAGEFVVEIVNGDVDEIKDLITEDFLACDVDGVEWV